MEFVDVPKPFEKIFKTAEEYVNNYFQRKIEDPQKAEISIGGERYLLVRAEGFSHQFIMALKELYSEVNLADATDLARGVLYDLAYAMGMADARVFHKATGMKDPIEKLSTGPIHFAFTGWGRVKIYPESSPSPDKDYFLIYDHPNSFESSTWLKAGLESDVPVCFMNAGYSAGWCTVSFGIPLVAVEVTCRAAGARHCHFLMAHRERIDKRLDAYFGERDRRPPEVKPLALRLSEIREQLKTTRLEARIHLLANEGSGECIIVLNEEGDIAYVNRSTLRAFGYSESELIGSEASLIFHGAYMKTLKKNKSWSGDLVLRRKDKTQFPGQITANAILGSEGDLLGYYIICRDITAIRKAEDERVAVERKLQEAMREHSITLSHVGRLAAIGELTAVMAHELNQPLGGIKNYLQGCLAEFEKERPDKTTLHEGLKMTTKLVDRATAIIMQLRHFARSNEEMMIPVYITDTINNVIEFLQPLFRKSGITLDVSLPAADPPLLGDPLRIEQIILNLIVNACEAMSNAELRRLSVQVKTGKNHTAEIVIKDTGTGIDGDIINRIFDPFFTTKKAGLGLGLSLSNTIAKEHGGSIHVVSEPGKGSALTLYLPLKQD